MANKTVAKVVKKPKTNYNVFKELRCHHCGKMFFKIKGTDYEVEIKCPRCHNIVSFKESQE